MYTRSFSAGNGELEILVPGGAWKFKIVPPAAEHLHFKFPIPKFDAGLRIKEAACQLRQAVSFVDV
ncbi:MULTISPECIES: hypothetical protein [Oscillospiraceae]|jgi:hypothetical protein|uniref:hypothetical protein n=1 Tax=Oscillospiraceae TaxID=216572 RepID=UPI0008221C66|nr:MULTISPECIES: hypothetical protein [Oscillospiraceae]SCJ69628.1 Uncharacterised protein [uncultured Blautia sp.]MCQ5043877.1 hypothetical protein [Dysosmobacter welbionis]MCU6750285.1 hypothetical protein [Oscillibacter acetigenes]MDR4034392.1 hypothetical protein [Dysosmobacter sp.]QCI60889.1 hypothetical protein EIO64_18160 [Dysosmobacter welbionis]